MIIVIIMKPICLSSKQRTSTLFRLQCMDQRNAFIRNKMVDAALLRNRTPDVLSSY
jgi:hypothetical protein